MHRVPTLATFALALLVCACRSAGVAECTDTGECPSDQVCNRHTRLCYKLAPVFTVDITEPTEQQSLVNHQFRLAGAITNATQGIASLEYQVADGGWTSVLPTSSGHFEAYPDLPSFNGDPVTVHVKATDGADHSTQASVEVLVDNVGPVATLTARDGERGHPLNVAVTFSEPVFSSDSTSDVPLTLAPADGAGEWNQTRTEYRITDLQPDTVYFAEVAPDAVRDAAGNVSAETHASFRTAPQVPPDGFRLAPPPGDGFDALDATSDQDGVVTLAAHALGPGGDQVVWGWFDPATGGFVSHAVASAGLQSVEVGASVDDPLDSPRIHTLTLRELVDGGVATQVFWSSDGNEVQKKLSGALAIVPGPPGCGEPGDPTTVAFVEDAGTLVYHRASESLPLATAPDHVAYASRNAWAFVSTANGSLQFTEPVYDCSGAGPLSSFRVAGPLDAGFAPASVSTVAVPGNVLAVFNGADWTATCSSCPTCQATTKQHLRLGAMHDGGSVLGAWRDSDPSVLVLGTADISQTCPPADWTELATFPDSSIVSEFRPVLVGHAPGLALIDADGGVVLHLAATP